MQASLLAGSELYREVVLDKIAHARESVWISTANVKAMLVEQAGRFVPVVDVFAKLARRYVDLRLLHADVPSRPFRAAFERHARLVDGGLAMRICGRVHFKVVLIDGAWLYFGSANLTGAGLGAKGDGRRNFELGLATEDAGVIDHVTAMFEAVWSGAECGTCRLYDTCPAPIGKRTTTPKRRARPARESGLQLGTPRKLPRAHR